jgi:hypothetical protein
VKKQSPRSTRLRLNASAKRKIIVLRKEDANQGSASDTDTRPAEKEKQDRSPEATVRYDFPATGTRTPGLGLLIRQLTCFVTGYLPFAVGCLHWREQASLEDVVVF